ncbi:MAG: SCO family protein [Magnetococcales bacterium]|nr:SCO family protein [Magnetococcales bacterium]
MDVLAPVLKFTPLKLLMLALLVGGLILAAIGLRSNLTATKELPKELAGILLPAPRDLQPFALTDHLGAPVDPARLRGGWHFFFFGYTHCPDVCPLSLGVLAEVFSQLRKDPKGVKDVHAWFVGVDTPRDTPQHMKEYLPFFDAEFLGVTGEPAAIQAFAKQLGAFYSIDPDPKNPEQPLITHSSAFFLIDPQGRFAGILQPNIHTPEVMVERFLRIRRHYGETS